MQKLPLGSFSFSFLLNNMDRLEVQSETIYFSVDRLDDGRLF